MSNFCLDKGYALYAALQFNILTAKLGLIQDHYLLDIGCGPIRLGRLLIIYLAPGHYFGIEPDAEPMWAALSAELGQEILDRKRPMFDGNSDFHLSVFGRKFDFLNACSVFSHAAPSQIRKCMAQAKEVLEPTGFFAASYCKGKTELKGSVTPRGERWEDTWCGGARFYTEQHMAGFVESAGLICREIDVRDCYVADITTAKSYQKPGMFRQDWIVIIHPENEQHLEDVLSLRER